MSSANSRYAGLLLGFCLILLAPSIQAAQALLWRVDTPQGASSYLFGTIHSEDPRVTSLPSPVKKRFAQADTVVLEMDISPQVQQQMAQAIMLPPQQKLSDKLPADLYRSVVEALSGHGYPQQVVDRLRPWAVILTLSMPQAKTGEFLDMRLYRQALSSGKTVRGLESADEQIGVFRDLSMADQHALLRQVLADYPKMPGYMEAITRAWLNRDMNKLMALNEESMSELPANLRQRFGRRLVEERNHRMAERAMPYLRHGGAFVAVGTLHLLGDEGLVALLRNKGMTVTPVY